MRENDAWLNLFLSIIDCNGYYDNLRKFMRKKGYNLADMADMLNNAYENAPKGMSPYYFMDSLEDAYPNMENEVNNIQDMVDYVYDHMLWKEY